MDQGSLSGMSSEFGGPDSGPGFMPQPPPSEQHLMSQRGGGSPEFISSQGKILLLWIFFSSIIQFSVISFKENETSLIDSLSDSLIIL